MSDVLRAPHVMEYTYTRSVGPVIIGALTIADSRLPTSYQAESGERLQHVG